MYGSWLATGPIICGKAGNLKVLISNPGMTDQIEKIMFNIPECFPMALNEFSTVTM